jgi:CheY-like chemotaxis protein
LLNAQRKGEEVVFSVRDNGMGIPPAMLHSIFDPFVQVEDSLDRCHGGLGIGLTLVRGLVELHGGEVEARSAGPGEGSEFLVRLPLPEEVHLATPAPRSVLSLEEGASRLILVVDDNVDSAESLSMLLRLKGHEVHMATSGQEALEMAARLRPEVVLLDIGLPGMNGYEVARRLKSRPETVKCLLIALTGFGQEEDRRRSSEAGFDSHLTKPVELEVLDSVIAAAALM